MRFGPERDTVKLPSGRYESVIFRPIEIPEDCSEWAAALGTLGVGGHIESGAKIMEAFVEGQEAVVDHFQARVEEIQVPNIRILRESVAATPTIFHLLLVDNISGYATERSSVVQQSYLEELSELEAEMSSLKRKPSYSIRDGIFLNGVEEGHHAVYYQLFPDRRPQGLDPASVSIAEYHAQESEWQALCFELKFAHERGVAPENLRLLVEEHREAAEVRRAQQLPLDDVPHLK